MEVKTGRHRKVHWITEWVRAVMGLEGRYEVTVMSLGDRALFSYTVAVERAHYWKILNRAVDRAVRENPSRKNDQFELVSARRVE
jgi:hypothetical protein